MEERGERSIERKQRLEECEDTEPGCWMSVSTITSLKKILHGTKIVSKKRCFAAMKSEGTSRWTRPCLYAFSSAASAASVTWEGGREGTLRGGIQVLSSFAAGRFQQVPGLTSLEIPASWVCQGSGGKPFVGVHQMHSP